MYNQAARGLPPFSPDMVAQLLARVPLATGPTNGPNVTNADGTRSPPMVATAPASPPSPPGAIFGGLSRFRGAPPGGTGNQPLGIMPGDQPDYGMGDFTRISDPNGAMTGPTRKPGFFGKGGGWRDVLGILADAVASASGGQPTYLPFKFKQRQHERDLEEAQSKHQQDLNDAIALAKVNAGLRPPQLPHYWESNDGSLMSVGPDGKPVQVYKDTTPKINWVRADNGDGTFTMVPIPIGGDTQSPSTSFGGGSPNPGAGQPSEAAIQHLRSNPQLAAQFDQKFGVGTAARVLGGH